jgi:hypothetical protein
MEILANTFDCQIGSYPFTYLSLPMGPSKPKVDDFLPLIQRIEKRLLSTSIFINQASRLEMVNAVLLALPTFFMGNVKLPPTVYKHIHKYRKYCMWRGADMNARKPCLAAWKLATRSKENGGMGIISLATQNDALLLKNLHKFYNRMDLPWVQFIWDNYYRNKSVPDGRPKGSFWQRGLLKLMTQFKGISSVQIQNGKQPPSGLICGTVKSDKCSHLNSTPLPSGKISR